MVDVEQMRSRADGDDKYWAQIKYAHELLLDSTSNEMRLAEVATANRPLLEPLFSDAVEGHEADRLTAVEMLRVLGQLVAEMDAELARRRAVAASSARPEPDASLRRSGREAPAREPDSDAASKRARRGSEAQAAVAREAPNGQQPPAMQLCLGGADEALPPAPGTPTPSTPPRGNRQRCLRRMESAEKLPSPGRPRRSPSSSEGGHSPSRAVPPSVQLLRPAPVGASSSSGGLEAVPSLLALSVALGLEPSDEGDSPVVDVEQMRSRADGDDKYWAQIKYAHQLLFDSTSNEMRLAEVAAANRPLLEPLFSDAVEGHEADRLTAVEMLRVLGQLVAEMDAELVRRRAATASSARPELHASLRRCGREAPAREPDEETASKRARRGGEVAVVREAPKGQQLSELQLLSGADEALPPAPGTPTPSTPPRGNRQRCFRRMESMEKLPSPGRPRRAPSSLEGGRSLPRAAAPSVQSLPLATVGASSSSSSQGGGGNDLDAVPSLLALSAALGPEPSDEGDSPMVDVERMRSRADGDDKYWAQIKYAHQLLLDSTSNEMRLAEVAVANRPLLEPLFWDAVAGQEADRLTAVEMLRVLGQLVAEMDAELARRRAAAANSARPELDTGLRRTGREAPAREPGEDAASKRAKRGGEAAAAAAATPPTGEPAPSTPPLVAVPPAARAAVVNSLPLRTPQRRRSTGMPAERTPPAIVRRNSKVKLEAQPAEGPEKLRGTAA